MRAASGRIALLIGVAVVAAMAFYGARWLLGIGTPSDDLEPPAAPELVVVSGR